MRWPTAVGSCRCRVCNLAASPPYRWRDHDTSEAWLIDLEDADAEPMLVAPRETAMRYEIEHHPDFGGYPALLMRTNAGAPRISKLRGRRLPPQPGSIGAMSWRTARAFSSWLRRAPGLAHLPGTRGQPVARRGPPGRSEDEHTIAFDEEKPIHSTCPKASSSQTDILRFSYSSMTTPSESVRTTILSPARAPGVNARKFRGGHDPGAYVTRRVLAKRRREAVPVSLLYRKTTPLDGTAPMARLRLRIVRDVTITGRISTRTGSRWSTAAFRVRDRPCAGRHRERLALVPRRAKLAAKAKHVFRFHRSHGTPGDAQIRCA